MNRGVFQKKKKKSNETSQRPLKFAFFSNIIHGVAGICPGHLDQQTEESAGPPLSMSGRTGYFNMSASRLHQCKQAVIIYGWEGGGVGANLRIACIQKMPPPSEVTSYVFAPPRIPCTEILPPPLKRLTVKFCAPQFPCTQIFAAPRGGAAPPRGCDGRGWGGGGG